MTASAMPTSPARTPRRAVFGWLSHFSERMKSAAAMRYEPQTKNESRSAKWRTASPVVRFNSTSTAANKAFSEERLVTAAGLPAEHLQHPVGDEEPADDVDRRGRDRDGPQHRAQSRMAARRDLNRGDDRNR